VTRRVQCVINRANRSPALKYENVNVLDLSLTGEKIPTQAR
jgi:hypothetical protein